MKYLEEVFEDLHDLDGEEWVAFNMCGPHVPRTGNYTGEIH